MLVGISRLVNVIIIVIIRHIRVVTSTSLLSLPHMQAGLYGCAILCSLACYVGITWTELEEFSMTEGILMYMQPMGGVQLPHVSLPKDVGWSGCKSATLLVDIIDTGVAPGIGVGVALIWHFLRKQQFLRVILPDPSTLIQYWQSGRTVMIFLLCSTSDWVNSG